MMSSCVLSRDMDEAKYPSQQTIIRTKNQTACSPTHGMELNNENHMDTGRGTSHSGDCCGLGGGGGDNIRRYT